MKSNITPFRVLADIHQTDIQYQYQSGQAELHTTFAIVCLHLITVKNNINVGLDLYGTRGFYSSL